MMLDYKECSDEQFKKAMKLCKEMQPADLPDDLLYIAFTKYRADAFSLSSAWGKSSPYSDHIWHATKVKRDELGAELERRGMLVMY